MSALRYSLSELRALASRLSSLPGLDKLVPAVSTASLSGLHDRHGHIRVPRGPSQHSSHASTPWCLDFVRHLASAQPLEDSSSDDEQTPYEDDILDDFTYPNVILPPQPPTSWGYSNEFSAASTSGDSSSIAKDGEVAPLDGPLYSNMVSHYQTLEAVLPSYTQRVSFDEFGSRYIEQIKREEAANQRALTALQKELAADDKANRVNQKKGAVMKRLVQTWVPLLTQVIEQEQDEVLAGNRETKRDRVNYGPYLLMLPAEELATMAIQIVLSKVATSMNKPDSVDSATAKGLEAAMTQAVALADAIGRAANDRVKHLRWKHHETLLQRKRQQQWAAWSDRVLGKQQCKDIHMDGGGVGVSGHDSSGDGLIQAGPKTAAGLEHYHEGAKAASATYISGQQRLKRLKATKGVSHKCRRNVEIALKDSHWDAETKVKVGAAILALLVEVATVPNTTTKGSKHKHSTAPAFHYEYVNTGPKRQAYIKASSPLLNLMLLDRTLIQELLAKSPPMLIPPSPWVAWDKGGYLIRQHSMMRHRMSHHVKQELRTHDYPLVLEAINVLGHTAWRVNRGVFDVMAKLWSHRSTAAGLPQQDPLKYPDMPSTSYRLLRDGGALYARGGPLTKVEKGAVLLERDDIRRMNRNMASIAATHKIKWQVAEEFVDAPEFYYPHTLDFRGRAYPIHPSLQHLGDDVCRGLLMFADKRPLGPNGLDWLYVHLANMWGQGQDKQSFDDRRRFTKQHLPQVLACSVDPSTNTWWQQAEKPWQCLAVCLEISGALKSLRPETYLSGLPVHMDGSCNGLQHYAALGRDASGGKAVNLMPSDSPQDVYKGVAAILAKRVEADATAGRSEALRVRGLIDRKLVKQTVMTSVYGVTPVGARAQIENRLKEKGFNGDKGQLWTASKYLADETLDALGEMFSNAKQIMNWLAECARVVAFSGETVKWRSPLGLPIAQPYHKVNAEQVTTVSQQFSVLKDNSDKGAPVTKARQRSAFPPNYIHSIDSAHMMRTALACKRAGIAFAGVHDSFWTHAGTVSDMNRLLREEFVAMHTEKDLLEDLLSQLKARYPGCEFPDVPPRGSLNIHAVKKSRYFFS